GRDVTDDACPLLYAGTRHHGLIVHVQRCAPRVETLHRRRPLDCPAAAWSRYVEVYETCSRVQTRGDSPRGSRAPVKLHSGLLDATRTHDLRAAAEAAQPYQPFHPSGSRPAAGMNNFTAVRSTLREVHDSTSHRGRARHPQWRPVPEARSRVMSCRRNLT